MRAKSAAGMPDSTVELTAIHFVSQPIRRPAPSIFLRFVRAALLMRLVRLLQRCINKNHEVRSTLPTRSVGDFGRAFDIRNASAGFAASKLLCRLYITLQIAVE